jgi:hypothetical protein
MGVRHEQDPILQQCAHGRLCRTISLTRCRPQQLYALQLLGAARAQEYEGHALFVFLCWSKLNTVSMDHHHAGENDYSYVSRHSSILYQNRTVSFSAFILILEASESFRD